MATITCRDCGYQRHRVPANTLYCKRCRLLRDIDFWRKKTRVCAEAGCTTEFAPLDRADRWCSTHNPGLRAHSGPCGLNPAHAGRYVTPALPVCADCCRNPKQRTNLIRALERGQADRRKANGHVVS